jgi:hypothetical protein
MDALRDLADYTRSCFIYSNFECQCISDFSSFCQIILTIGRLKGCDWQNVLAGRKFILPAFRGIAAGLVRLLHGTWR